MTLTLRYLHAVDNRAAWESEADAWVKWARTPGHDAYWQFRTAFFNDVVPQPRRRTLEVGCGEGRVARDLVARGHEVTAVDGSPTLLRHAVDADSKSRYCLADSVALPFKDASFDLAIAYNSLMDFDDMPTALQEIARVLEVDGHLCICMPHPFLEAGSFENASTDAAYRLTKSYLGSRTFDSIEERDGLSMHFTGWSRSLEEYVAALATAGYVIEDLREPVPESRNGRYERWHRYPMFLNLRACKR
jgi:ubiquinone/menaquinone biosynthesis C-methylase UbiE